jgi:uncharacterized protein with HEPN domain
MTLAPDAMAFLWDARLAGEKITRYTTGQTYDSYLENDMLRSAVERQFEIAGEALRNLRRAFPALAAEIPDLGRVVAFRNVLIHGYASIDHQVVWTVVGRELPALLTTLTTMLDRYDPAPTS